MADKKLILTEKVESRDGKPDYTTKWYCEPPSLDETFTVIRQEWCHNGAVRKIFEVTIVENRRPVVIHDSQSGKH